MIVVSVLVAITLQYQRAIVMFQTAMNGLLLMALILAASASYSRFTGLGPRWKAARLPVALLVLANVAIGWLYFAAESLFWEWSEGLGAPRGAAFAVLVLAIFGLGGVVLGVCLRILVGTWLRGDVMLLSAAAVLTAIPFVLPVPWDVKIRWSAVHVGLLGVVSVFWIHGAALGCHSR